MITSVHNPKVQEVRKLLSQARQRQQEQACVVEGVRLVEEAWQAGWKARQVFFTGQLDERGRHVVHGFAGQGAPVEQISEAVMASMSETETPQGLLAVVSVQALPLPQVQDFVLVLDRLRDPGNLGTVLRTAAAARVDGVLLAPGCADAWMGKVLRAGMGAHFHLPIHTLKWPAIGGILNQPENKLSVYLADSGSGQSCWQVDFRTPLALIVGGEATGASSDARSLADMLVHIPMPGGSESLNAAVAAGILLFEVVRQRQI